MPRWIQFVALTLLVPLAVGGLVWLGLGMRPGPAPARAQSFESRDHAFRVVPVATGLRHPWGLAFLPGGDMLVTERPGALRRVGPDGRVSAPLDGLPPVRAAGQGGLMDVALHPDFERNRRIYLTHTRPAGRGRQTTALTLARLAGDRLTQRREIFRAEPALSGGRHFGARIAFGGDGKLYMGMGERGRPPLSQDLSAHMGSMIRLDLDGSVPADNPFIDRAEARPEIFAYGLRNPQGLATHPRTGRIWEQEHGPQGGDEINLIARGANYGWPETTHGEQYGGGYIGPPTASGITPPLHYWDPSIAPSGLAFYTGDKFPAWRGSLFSGALALTHLNRLSLEGREVTGEERLLEGWGQRIRDVVQGPEGYLWILTDSPRGGLYRLEPEG